VIPLTIPFSVIGLLAVIYMLYIFATLSRRLGLVTKMKPYYRGFYIAMILVAIAIVVTVLPPPAAESERSTYFLAYYATLIPAGVISLVVAYRYWGWLFRERTK